MKLMSLIPETIKTEADNVAPTSNISIDLRQYGGPMLGDHILKGTQADRSSSDIVSLITSIQETADSSIKTLMEDIYF